LDLLLSREIPALRRWARGRLPTWARSFVDTADLVQDALTRTLPHLGRFEPQREKALQAYLRSVVENRIRDELRRASRTPSLLPIEGDEAAPSGDASPLDSLVEAEDEALLARALARLRPADQAAVVARLRLGYSYEQIALVLQKRTANAARMAVTRAIERLIDEMRLETEPHRG
jgi:RNA polymerase sigma-70 factor (ECF subfamily)